MRTISGDVARRTFLAAQGFADPRPAGAVTRRHLGRVLDRVKLLQLDSVNVAVRAHYMPIFSRLGAYPASLLDDAAWSPSARRPRLLAETWAHEASLVLVQDWPLLGHETLPRRWWKHYGPLLEKHPSLAGDIRDVVAESGPIGAGAIEKALAPGGRAGTVRPRPPGATWWERSEVKRVCEYLFAVGDLAVGTRKHFERRYDLPERVLPLEVLDGLPPDPADAARELIAKAASALGVGTETDLRDYYRLGPERTRTAIDELVDGGRLEPVAVRGWAKPAYRDPAARAPRTVEGRALLCPFDPLVWERDRTERIFGFRYRIEIYVPEPQREYGYYVFPFLLDGRLVGRVDLKAARAAGVLRVPGAFAEPGAPGPESRIAAELAAELTTMAGWLGLDGVVVGERGGLAAPLHAELRRSDAA
ncbi:MULTISPECIES: winged helix-turn-helix domain-containing protein [unclassified Pseudonocardia]|uniref:winged helix-turn-helix domain-containing protein n=1 Tax=unclassified Pseudonocardia TaxID=2619320 RepID=UPI00094B2B69|nr:MULTISPECIES: crosslink repair DNA glycosylase YcaQ family protein [unclassified Pseudonocardia]